MSILDFKAHCCAKIILSGEHAVVYGGSAVATSISLYMHTSLYKSSSDKTMFSNIAADSILRDFLNKIQDDFNNTTFKPVIPNDYHINITSEIPIRSGFGSSAAFSVCLAKIIQQLYPERNNLLMDAYSIESLFHNTPSGLDVATVLSESTIFFNSIKHYTNLKINSNLWLHIINTEERNISTQTAITKLRHNENNSVFNIISELSKSLASALESDNITSIKHAIKENHRILKSLGCYTSRTLEAVDFLESMGAVAAKMSGAGFGGIVFGLFTKPKLIDNVKYVFKLK